MKIIFLIRSLNYGGAERQLVTLAKGLHERKCSVLVLVFYPNGPLEKDLIDAGVQVYSLNKRGRWDIFSFLMRLVRVLRQEKPDILHGYLGTSNILTILLKPFSRNIRMVWGVRASNMDLAQYDWLSCLSYKIECQLSRFADLIIVNSHAGFDYAVAHGLPKTKMVVIPNGIDTERFRPDRKAGLRLRAKWGIAEEHKLVGLVGRLDPMKDHITFLKAAAILIKERKDIRFVCVGDGPEEYRENLHELSKQLGLAECLVWAGACEDMLAVYNALDICSSSSSYGEGFPNVIGEAMACGVPCVVTDVGDSALIVGDTGIVVPPKSPEQLAKGWELMLQEIDNNDLKENVRMRISINFSKQKLIQTTSKFLCRLL